MYYNETKRVVTREEVLKKSYYKLTYISNKTIYCLINILVLTW